MAKTLYSLMLNDEIVREVDRLAHSMGTNRSNMVNTILAEYVGYVTPERRINDILSQIEQLLQPTGELVPFLAPNALSLSLKSSLAFKYRPTIKYEVQLYRGGGDAFGELDVIFRTQSAELLSGITAFFRAWRRTEDAFFPAGRGPEYALYDGRLTRTLLTPRKDVTSEQLAAGITEYVQAFDDCMKKYLAGMLTEYDLQRRHPFNRLGALML